MLKKFLENEQYSFFIAKVAIVFQSLITGVVMILLLCILLDVGFPERILLVIVCLDGLFVVAHLSYRRAYLGPRVVLAYRQKIILSIHIASALTALLMTSFLVYLESPVGKWFVITALIMWGVSLSFGLLFFTKKYSVTRFAQ